MRFGAAQPRFSAAGSQVAVGHRYQDATSSGHEINRIGMTACTIRGRCGRSQISGVIRDFEFQLALAVDLVPLAVSCESAYKVPSPDCTNRRVFRRSRDFVASQAMTPGGDAGEEEPAHVTEEADDTQNDPSLPRKRRRPSTPRAET